MTERPKPLPATVDGPGPDGAERSLTPTDLDDHPLFAPDPLGLRASPIVDDDDLRRRIGRHIDRIHPHPASHRRRSGPGDIPDDLGMEVAERPHRLVRILH